jgi:hypothetical protein
MDFIKIKGIHTNLSETDIGRQYEADKGGQRLGGGSPFFLEVSSFETD